MILIKLSQTNYLKFVITVVKVSLGVTAGVAIISFIISLLMLLGVYQQKEKYLKVAVIVNVVMFVINCIYQLVKFFAAVGAGGYGSAFAGLIGSVISLCKYFISLKPNPLVKNQTNICS